MTSGHELVFLPLMPDWHNATTTKIEDLKVEPLPEQGQEVSGRHKNAALSAWLLGRVLIGH